MYTIENFIESTLIIKNSKFISLIYKINDIDEINKILKDIKLLYPDATHYCYAYILNDLKKSSDDGEPSGTAGIPILKVLEKSNLTNILAITIRYFGGTKLGAGGLVRAYTKSIASPLSNATLKEIVKGYNINITFPYTDTKNIDYLLKDIKINEKIFKEMVTYNIDVPLSFLETIKNHNLEYQIIKEINIEKSS